MELCIGPCPPPTVTLQTAVTELLGTTTGGGFNNPSATPLPGALPLFATGLGVMGLFGWRRNRKNGAALAALAAA